MRSIGRLLNRLELAEQAFLGTEVLAPVLAGQPVGVQIAGVFCRLQVDDQQYEGWAVLQPLSLQQARIVRQPRLVELRAYLWLFPAVRLIAVARSGRRWYALPAQRGDTRISIQQPVPVALAGEELQPFDTLLARFDGRLFLFERRDERRNPALAAYLRQALDERLPPARLRKRGLSAEERAAYAWAWQELQQAQRDQVGEQLGAALAHAGGRLVSFLERAEAYTVTYELDGRQHSSTVRKDDLTVLTAGICLSGQDHHFDLTSLVGVLREAFDQGTAPDPD